MDPFCTAIIILITLKLIKYHVQFFDFTIRRITFVRLQKREKIDLF
jgi:hypothetical protein